MKNKSFLFELVVSLLLIVSPSGTAKAAQQAANSRAGDIKSAQPANVAAKPLQQPITLQLGAGPSLCTILDQTDKEAIPLVNDLENAARLYQTETSIIRFDGVYDIFVQDQWCNSVHPSCFQDCCSSQHNFSVQEQQAAGCASSDTVQQCMDKLVRQCIKTIVTKNNYKTKLQKSKQKADEMASKAKLLSDKINKLLTIMP